MEQGRQAGILLATAILVFTSVTFLLVRMMQPRRQTDYLLVGTLATMVCLVTLFFALNKTLFKGSDVFFKRRRD